MARQLRKKSGTGIYHVMVRGINRQDIFNKKYERSGHLFQDRFRSEPVDSLEYFEDVKHCRLVVQRQRMQKGEQLDIFDGEYTYRCILTNDWDMTDEEIIQHYNKRGTAEQVFDRQNGFWELQRDYVLASPSTAASYCSGRSCNGWLHWINDEGQSLDELYRSE